jgi:high-affinity iron transporter
MGVALGVLICLIIGGGMIGAFYGLSSSVWGNTEYIWEGVFAIIASLIITIMGAALLRVSKMQAKWAIKIRKLMEKPDPSVAVKKHPLGQRFKVWSEKYAVFLLPFITVLREGLEAVVFIGGVGVGLPASSFPLAVICGLLCGTLIGYLIYK